MIWFWFNIKGPTEGVYKKPMISASIASMYSVWFNVYRKLMRRQLERELLYNPRDLPATLLFTGTVKLHGTHATVARAAGGGELFLLSRNRAVTVEDDNLGLAAHWLSPADPARAAALHRLLDLVAVAAEADAASVAAGLNGPAAEVGLVAVAGEWCGRSIMGGTGISQLDPMYVIYAARYLPASKLEPAHASAIGPPPPEAPAAASGDAGDVDGEANRPSESTSKPHESAYGRCVRALSCSAELDRYLMRSIPGPSIDRAQEITRVRVPRITR